MTISKLMDWAHVPGHLEVSKFERYALFSKAFIRLTPQNLRQDACDLLSKWVKIAQTDGKDIAESIYDDYCMREIHPRELEDSLLIAITVITEGNFIHNSKQEIIDANKAAIKLYTDSLIDLIKE